MARLLEEPSRTFSEYLLDFQVYTSEDCTPLIE